MRSIAIISIVPFLLLSGCLTFETPKWKTVDLREGLDYETAWQMLVDRVNESYDIEFIDKQSGYLRTDWKYHSYGLGISDRRTRITVNFPSVTNPTQVNFKYNIHVLVDHKAGRWSVLTVDPKLVNDTYDILSDLLGSVQE